MSLKTLEHVSASQISTYSQCPRKHWLEKIEGVFVPTSPGAAFGTRGHAAVESRILTGAWPDDPEAVQVAMAGWKFVPQGRRLVEQEMRLEDAALPVVGRIDLVCPDVSEVIDHKFLASFRNAKTPEQLARDPQAILYCTWALRKGHLRPSSIGFRHIVYRTRDTPAAITVYTPFSVEALAAAYSDTQKTIERMAAHAALTDAAAVPAAMGSDDDSPCKAYGGCPHLARCKALSGRSIWSSFKDTKKEGEMNVMDKLAQKRKSQGLEGADVGAVNPPEFAQEPGPSPAPAAPVKAEPVQVTQFSLDFPPSAAEMAVFHSQKALVQPPESGTSKINDQFALYTLYVGCLPVNENFVLLDHWLAPLLDEAAQALGVDYYAQAGFGQGKASLAALVLHKIKSEGIPPVMVVDPRLPASETVLEILRSRYTRLVMRIG